MSQQTVPVDSLPSGTVTLLFSDIEGSTALLSRLGPAYAGTLDNQREIMRQAWIDNAGVEIGTEGDSFFVVFATAPEAVAAAAQAQRGLAAYCWPNDETVRVRIGIHTGSPTIHDGGYVGMDVHRAARIMAAGHGGQVVLSASTAALVEGALPDDSRIDDLGSHQLKDLPMPERVFQLTLADLPSSFPPLRTVGAASRLPTAPTPLIGRDDDVDDVVSLVGSGRARLVTLTGPGGAGKTRLAIAIAERLAETTEDGVYFVPLSMDTTAETAWAALAEQLDLPADRRSPEELMDAVATRRAAYVLDNLEQLDRADDVAARLLAVAPPGSAVIATSRRPLHMPAEHEHPVRPLDLPEGNDVAQAQASPAVQLFAEHARRSHPRFEVTAENAADIAAICRRLDGLPLAIELAAARTRLLSPKALRGRLDRVLDLADTGRQRPTRQRTLRDTIAVSYELLSAHLQAVFRRLGVFAGGADLAAIEAVAVDPDGGEDVLDLVSELADASLVAVSEAADGEPRIAMLETIRAYANELLAEHGEFDDAHARHARHILAVVEGLSPMLTGDEYWEARRRFEAEDANIREALAWALPEAEPTEDGGRGELGLLLCAEVGPGWASATGYLSSDRLPLIERALKRGPDADSRPRAKCLIYAGACLWTMSEFERALEFLDEGASTARRIDDAIDLVTALGTAAQVEISLGRIDDARERYHESLAVARALGTPAQLHQALSDFATFVEAYEKDHEESLRLKWEALAIAREIDSPWAIHADQHNIACTLRMIGRVDEAHALMRSIIPDALTLRVTTNLMSTAEDYAAILAELGHHRAAARLLGAADAMHDDTRMPRVAGQVAEIDAPLAKARESLPTAAWMAAYNEGRASDIEELIAQTYREIE